MKIRLKDITYGLIKRLYPNPTKAAESTNEEGEYCVGGALLMTVAGDGTPSSFDSGTRFPGEEKIGEALCEVNPYLNMDDACAFSMHIISYNDDSHFKRAWSVVRRALKFKSKPDEDEEDEE